MNRIELILSFGLTIAMLHNAIAIAELNCHHGYEYIIPAHGF